MDTMAGDNSSERPASLLIGIPDDFKRTRTLLGSRFGVLSDAGRLDHQCCRPFVSNAEVKITSLCGLRCGERRTSAGVSGNANKIGQRCWPLIKLVIGLRNFSYAKTRSRRTLKITSVEVLLRDILRLKNPICSPVFTQPPRGLLIKRSGNVPYSENRDFSLHAVKD